MFLCHSCQSIVLLNVCTILSFNSKHVSIFSQNQYKFFYNGSKPFNSCITLCNYIITICISITSILTTQVLLKSGDIETIPGPKKSSAIRFRHWNLNGMAAHDFVKVPFIEAFIIAHNFDIVCLSETFLDSSVPDHDENININGYSLLRVDHPNNINRGGVCMYFKESLPLIRRSDLSNMKECLVTEINVNNEKCFFICLYRSPVKVMRS